MAALEAMSDEQLLLAYGATGASEPFAELCRRLSHSLLLVCWRVLRDHHEAEDALQITLVNVSRNAANFRGDSVAFTWICRIAINAALDCLRRSKCWRKVGLPDFALDFEACLEVVAEDLAQQEQRQRLLELVAQLPPVHRQVIQLVDLDGASYDDAAAAIGIPIGTVRSRLHRARRLLRELLPADYLFTD